MRWYKIEIGGGAITYDATNDPNALNVILDISTTSIDAVQPSSFVRIEGIPLSTIKNARNFIKKDIIVSGGMQKGLPLANPNQQGVLGKGSIFPAYGNWVNTDMTLDLLIVNKTGESFPKDPSNVIHNWKKGQPLSDSLKTTLTTAFPNLKPIINISSKLVLPFTDTGFYQTLGQFSNYINQISRSIMSDNKYQGVKFGIQGSNLIVTDGTQQLKAGKINFQDLVGQPIWTNTNAVQFKTVMRGDIIWGQYYEMPQAIAQLTSNAATTNDRNNTIQGTFQITKIRHTGNFRQADWASWCTTFDAVYVSGANTKGSTSTGKAGGSV